MLEGKINDRNNALRYLLEQGRRHNEMYLEAKRNKIQEITSTHYNRFMKILIKRTD